MMYSLLPEPDHLYLSIYCIKVPSRGTHSPTPAPVLGAFPYILSLRPSPPPVVTLACSQHELLAIPSCFLHSSPSTGHPPLQFSAVTATQGLSWEQALRKLGRNRKEGLKCWEFKASWVLGGHHGLGQERS